MDYYLQVLIGAIAMVLMVLPFSNNIKEIKVRNIFAAILVMFVFGFLLLSDFVRGFFKSLAMV